MLDCQPRWSRVCARLETKGSNSALNTILNRSIGWVKDLYEYLSNASLDSSDRVCFLISVTELRHGIFAFLFAVIRLFPSSQRIFFQYMFLSIDMVKMTWSSFSYSLWKWHDGLNVFQLLKKIDLFVLQAVHVMIFSSSTTWTDQPRFCLISS